MKKAFSLICLTAATISLHAQIYQISDLQSHKWISEDETTLSVSFSAKDMVYQAERRDRMITRTDPVITGIDSNALCRY